jgi:hypothetical protein
MIERIWEELARLGTSSQRRIDATHPHDLYADFAPPAQMGLVAVCTRRPQDFRPMRAIALDVGERADGRWSLRMSLSQPALRPVFAALCRDVVASTADGVTDDQLGAAVLARLQRWRALLERDVAGLDDAVLRGLIGELTVLETRLLPHMSLMEAVSAWRGPSGAPQDFLLPSGELIETKAVDRDAAAVRIHGAAQLDGGTAPLILAVVRLQTTAPGSSGATTAPRLVLRVRQRLSGDADALRDFDAGLAAIGWHDHPAHDDLAVRILQVDAYAVLDEFPRLTMADVPFGVGDLDYSVTLPATPTETWNVPE